ncbi:MAG: hypothetical protein C3F18_03020 [Nitrosomonadales bacterium]|nr:MAG: hypothetical protein C3F18_03020 [Nitrosomonadales bacterium]
MSMQLQAQVKPNSIPIPSFTSLRIGLQRKCADDDCAERRKKLSLQRSSINLAEPSEVPPIVHDVLRSPGQPLDTTTRAFMEPRFGHDFSQVRVHTDAKAAESARAVNALAYTMGRNVVCGTGQYAPGTSMGHRLLAHELAHVVQQQRANSYPYRFSFNRPSDPLEVEAERVANAITALGMPHANIGPTSIRLSDSSPLLMRAIAYDMDCQPHQKEVESNVSRAQKSAARWAKAALASLAKPDDVASLLRRHFNIDARNTAAVTRIRSIFEALVGTLEADVYTYHCRPDSDARCKRKDGKEIAGFAYEGGFHIYFCEPYPYQNFFGHKSLIDTLLHEAAHAHNTSFSHDTYEWEDSYPGRNPLTNADSYSSFARDAALGRGTFTVELSLGGLLSAEPQFYIAAGISEDVGGPALDVFNLKLGYRLAYTPGTKQQPTRIFQAADIGLRINPISERVYVDLTTGAFFGANVTDTKLMAGIANRLSAGYRGERIDLGLDLSHLYDLVSDEHLVIVGVRGGVRF